MEMTAARLRGLLSGVVLVLSGCDGGFGGYEDPMADGFNSPPTVSAGANQTVVENSPVALVGSAADLVPPPAEVQEQGEPR